ncbi:MAG: hypothetical protein R3C30_13920 [Hyphomonadaceae bacterium]
MTEHRRANDVRLYLLAIGAAVLVCAAIGALLGGVWSGILLFGGFFLGNAVLKALQPSNTLLNRVSWNALVVTAGAMMALIYLIENPRWLGGWTIIVVFGALFVYGLISVIVSARQDDGVHDDGAD